MQAEKLTPSQRIGYGVGDFGINLYFISVMTYLLYFYTDVFGLSPIAAGWVLLVARFVDAITDPIMGAIAERTRSRWGRLRPHILFGAVPLGIIAILTFSTPDYSDAGKLWWAYLTYISFGIAYTVVSIPYSALTASMTTDHQERTMLSTVRMAFAFGGGLAISVGMLPLVGLFENEAAGYQWSLAIFAVVATVLLWITVAVTQEKIQPPASQKLSLMDSLKAVFSNPPLLVVIVMFTCGMLSFTVRQTASLYYFQYNLGRGDLIPLFFLLTMPVMFVGLLFVPKLAEIYGKAGGIAIGAVITIVGSLGLYFTPYDAITWVFIWSGVMALGGTPIAVLGWAMIPDTVEYAQWKTGLRADGAIFAFASFFQKTAKAIGGVSVAWVLGFAGYVAKAEQTEASLEAIRALMTLAPMAIMVVLIIAARAYRLDAETHTKIVQELQSQGKEMGQSEKLGSE